MTAIERITLNFVAIESGIDMPGLRVQIPATEAGESIHYYREWDAIEVLNELISEGPSS